MIVVTHEIGFAREAADRVVFMDGGVVVEQGPPEQVIANPRHPRTQAFYLIAPADLTLLQIAVVADVKLRVNNDYRFSLRLKDSLWKVSALPNC